MRRRSIHNNTYMAMTRQGSGYKMGNERCKEVDNDGGEGGTR